MGRRKRRRSTLGITAQNKDVVYRSPDAKSLYCYFEERAKGKESEDFE